MTASDASVAPTIICVAWPAGANVGAAVCDPLRAAPRLGNSVSDDLHGPADLHQLLVVCQRIEIALARQLDVDAQPVRPTACLEDEVGGSIRNGLEMDVAPEPVIGPESARHLHELLHGGIGPPDDSRAEKEPFDIIASVEFESEPDDFVGGEAGTPHAAKAAIDAVGAIVDAVAGQKHLSSDTQRPSGV